MQQLANIYIFINIKKYTVLFRLFSSQRFSPSYDSSLNNIHKGWGYVITHTLQAFVSLWIRPQVSLSRLDLLLLLWFCKSVCSALWLTEFRHYITSQSGTICGSLSLEMDLRCLLCAHFDIHANQAFPFPFYPCYIFLNAVVFCDKASIISALGWCH